MDLNDDEIKKLIERIARPTYNFLHKRIDKELTSFPNIKELTSFSDIIYIIISALSSVDANLLSALKGKIEHISEVKINGKHLLRIHSKQLVDTFDLIESDKKKKSMN